MELRHSARLDSGQAKIYRGNSRHVSPSLSSLVEADNLVQSISWTLIIIAAIEVYLVFLWWLPRILGIDDESIKAEQARAELLKATEELKRNSGAQQARTSSKSGVEQGPIIAS